MLKGHSSRQRPVACHFCRSRKLRCSRQFPCPNCTARGIKCELYASQELPVSNDSGSTSKRNSSVNPDSEVLSRIRRLEDIVTRSTGHIPTDIADLGVPPIYTKERGQPPKHPATTDAEWLERTCISQNLLEAFQPHKTIFRTCPIRKITRHASYIHPIPPDPSWIEEPMKCIWLPYHEESKVLLERYLDDITYIHHVVHPSSIRKTLDHLYEDLDKQAEVRPGHIALLLSILASATFSWTLRDTDTIFSTVDEANRQSTSWIVSTLDALEYSRRTTSGTIEDIQAMIILSFVICSLEGMSSRYWNLISTSIMMARELSLHRIDHYSPPALTTIFPPDSVQAEVGRRIWWYLAATDWMLGRYPGPHEGVYTINPRHMTVKKPLHINDEDLVDGVAGSDLPISQPTSMSYFLRRIQLAELCRDFTDRVPLCVSGSGIMAYGQVIEFDSKIEKFLEELPTFFSLDENSTRDLTPDEQRKDAPGIVVQRYILNSLVYANRCKLHIPYLAQGSVEPAFARSREICLHSARMVIKTEQMLEIENLPFALTRLKFCGALYCIFMAAVVLVLDICFDKDAAQDDSRKEEVAGACRILEKAREQSTMAAKLLDSLMSVLRKYQISLTARKTTTTTTSHPTRAQSSSSSLLPGLDFNFCTTPQNIVQKDDHIPNFQRPTDPPTSYFDELWQSFDFDMEVDTMEWSSMLSELALQQPN